MVTTNIKFRNATSEDISIVMSLWRQSFADKNDEYWRIVEDRLQAGLKTKRIIIRLAFDESCNLIGSVQHLISHIRVGNSMITNSHLGEVSVLPAIQGMGLGSQIMQDSIKWLESESGIHTASLGGLVKFYSRFGFTVSPSYPYLTIPFKNERGGVKNIPFYEVIAIKDKAAIKKICEFDPVNDKDGYFRLQNPDSGQRQYDEGDYSFEHVERKYCNELSRLAYEENGNMPAYLFAYNGNTIYDFGAEDNEIGYKALSTLLRSMLHGLNAKGVTELRIAGGNIRHMADLLNNERIAYDLVYGTGGHGSHMVFIPNLRRLFESISDELNRRLALLPFPWTGKIKFHVRDRKLSCALIVKNNHIESVLDEILDPYDVEISMPQSHMIMKLYNYDATFCRQVLIAPLTPLAINLFNIIMNDKGIIL